jgi:hypothetical protein
VTGHLRLVPVPGEAPASPRRRRKGIRGAALSLTPDEVRHFRAAARNVARVFGGVGKLAAAMGVNANVLTRKRRPSPALAVALWRLTGIPVESMLRPTLAAVPAPAPTTGGGAA